MSTNTERIRNIILWAIILMLIMMWSPDIRLLRTTLRGTLSSGKYPAPSWSPVEKGQDRWIEEIMVLETYEAGELKRYFLSCRCRSIMLYARAQGQLLVGGMTADEWYVALQEGRLVEITGHKWTDFYNGTRYSCLEIIRSRIVE